MLISVVIGALNEEKYIGKTLESLKAQKTRYGFEIIVGDGYSDDNTVKVAKSFGAKVVKERRRSAAFERQAGAKIAKGEVIAFTDADAQLPVNWVENIGKAFESDKNVVMVYGPVYFSDAGGVERLLSRVVMDNFLSFCAALRFDNPIGSNLSVRRSVFEGVGGFNTERITAEDLDLAKRLSGHGKLAFRHDVYADVSARRVKRWGYLYFSIFHIYNALKFQFTGRSETRYEPVR